MAKLGVITDGISRDFEHALDVMNEFGLEHAELQFLWDKEVGDLSTAKVTKVKDLVSAHGQGLGLEIRNSIFKYAQAMSRWRT